jgi:hypothetical protein
MTRNLSRFTSWCQAITNTLWLSVSSADFYRDVHKLYRGYGIRYILNLYLISGLIFCLWGFNHLLRFEGEISPANPDVEYVLKQIPEIYYDGTRITTKSETPFFLYNSNNHKIAAIDPNNELTATDTKDIPLLFFSTYLKMPIESGFSKASGTNAEYKYILGTNPAAVNHETIIQYLPKLWQRVNNTYVYALAPIGGLLYFGVILLCNIFYAIVIFAISYFLGITTSLQTAYRMTMFASGAPLFLQPLLFMISPSLMPILTLVSLAAWVFMVMGIVGLKKK